MAKGILTHLTNQEKISIALDARTQVFQDVESLLSQYVRTDEDLERGASAAISGVQTDESSLGDLEMAALNIEKRAARENSLNGFYFSTSVRQLATTLVRYLWDNAGIDDVFCDDDELTQAIVNYIRVFEPRNAQ